MSAGMWWPVKTLISPKSFFYLSNKLLPWLSVFCVLTMGYGLVGGLILAPADYLQGDGFRIIYVHAPAAFLSLFIYAVMAVAAFSSIVWQLKLAPLVIRHSTTLGANFAFLALLTGSLWGKPMWGTWWLWDARLTSELILFFLYIGILLFQNATHEKRASHRALAIFILVGAIDLPIIHYSVYWWNTLHQGATLKLFAESSMDARMLYPLLSMITAFLLYYAIVLLFHIRYDLIVNKNNPHWLQERT